MTPKSTVIVGISGAALGLLFGWLLGYSSGQRSIVPQGKVLANLTGTLDGKVASAGITSQARQPSQTRTLTGVVRDVSVGGLIVEPKASSTLGYASIERHVAITRSTKLIRFIAPTLSPTSEITKGSATSKVVSEIAIKLSDIKSGDVVGVLSDGNISISPSFSAVEIVVLPVMESSTIPEFIIPSGVGG
jgi:hypothetical protein